MNTKRTCFTAALLAFLLIVASLLSFGIFSVGTQTAYADGENPETESVYEGLYYFSDYYESQSYFNGFLKDAVDEYKERNDLFYFDYELNYWGDYFYQYLNNYYNSGEFTDVSNSFIIFEIRQELPREIDKEDSYLFTDLLFDLFGYLKDNGCKIMFICGTDESRFETHNDFLDYVDIHINTDMFTLFAYSIIQDIEEDGLSDFTLVLDENIADSDFMYYYLIPHLREMYNLPSYSDEYDEIAEVLAYCNISVYVLIDEDTMIDYVSGQIYSATSVEIYSYRIYAIGTTEYFENPYTWLDCLLCWRDQMGFYAFPVYIYGYVDYSSGQYDSDVVHGTGSDYYYLNDTLADIMYDFVMGNDLTVYDNWPGRCVVTYKPISFGPNGWMSDFVLYLQCWDIYMDEDTYAFYFGGIVY